jgi:hypothetical protein
MHDADLDIQAPNRYAMKSLGSKIYGSDFMKHDLIPPARY